MNDASVLYHEDLAVGLSFSTATHLLDQQQIQSFAALYDPQPFHLDPELAKATLFGGLAASGWQTAAVTMKLMVESGLQLAGGMIGAGCELNWPAPTRPGDILHVEGEIIEVTPVGAGRKRGMAVMRGQTKNQHGTVVQTLVAKLVVQCRPQA